MDSLVNQKLFGGLYQGKKILITGITGFKGSWLAVWLRMLGARVIGIGLVPETSTNHFELLDLKYQNVDIRDRDKLEKVIQKEQPDLVFHLAAQSLVRKSYKEPLLTYETNVQGSLNIYLVCSLVQSIKGVVSVTSDKVYENKEKIEPYKESDELGGFDMYSSSKACVELMTASYMRAYKSNINFPIVTARAGNVIGGGDWAEDRLIPDVVRAVERNQSVYIRNPESIRPWQHVLEPLSGYLVLGQRMLSNTPISGAWNFGPLTQSAMSVRIVLERSQIKWKNITLEFESNQGQPHEAGILIVDSSKSNNLLSWYPIWDTNKAIDTTIDWYKLYLNEKSINTTTDIIRYVDDARKKELNWAIPC